MKVLVLCMEPKVEVLYVEAEAEGKEIVTTSSISDAKRATTYGLQWFPIMIFLFYHMFPIHFQIENSQSQSRV